MYVKVQLLPSDSPPLRAARVQDDEEDVKYQKVAAVINFFTSNDAILQLLLQIVTQVYYFDFIAILGNKVINCFTATVTLLQLLLQVVTQVYYFEISMKSLEI